MREEGEGRTSMRTMATKILDWNMYARAHWGFQRVSSLLAFPTSVGRPNAPHLPRSQSHAPRPTQ